MVLKKSRYFVGGKRQEITSYNEFSLGNYKPGESIEHLKMKSADIEQWGESNIIFADSIQITSNLNPLGLTELLNNIEEQLENQPTIEIPKLEKVIEEDIINELNNNLLEQILNENLQTIIEEFTVYGVYFCFNYLSSKFQLSYRRQDNRYIREVIEGELTIRHVRDFLNSIDENYDIDKVKLKLFTNESRGFTIPIKEVLDCFMDIDGVNYFLKEGEWLKFNNTFMEYLKRSINNITLEREQNDFNEQNYLQWKQEKERQINAPGYIGDRITYREYYFNGSQVRNGYILMDRELTQIESLLQVRRNYRLEVADLYKDNTIWSVKFFKRDEKEKIIYNIEQSKIALEFIVQDNILDNSYDVKNIGLWFIVDEGHEFNEILEINSIQILLALEFWNQKVIEYGFNPIIKFTKRINI
ncbi:MAG: TIGR04141 family sporadically distributed protein [Leptospiraceae bacterium]|nr:TIGR04141 family sporadically distributed protein [Leptospiraceae bacterium]